MFIPFGRYWEDHRVGLKEQNCSRLTDSEKGLAVQRERVGKAGCGGKEKGIKGHYNPQSQYRWVMGKAVQHGEDE